MPTPKQFADAIKANVADWYADRIDHPTFSIRQRAFWKRIEGDRETQDGVLAILREGLKS